MLMRYGQAALLAALATLMGNVVWAQQYSHSPPNLYAASDCCQKAKSCNNKGCCAKGACRKDGQNGCIGYCFEIVESDGKRVGQVGTCCKDGQCCNSKKCDKECTCCKNNKCECSKGGDCCKDGKCSCKDKSGCCCKDNKCECGKGGECNCKNKTSVTKMGCGCPFLNKLAKNTAIIMVMPSSLPLLGACHPAAMGMMPHPLLPMGPQVMLPPMLPPPPMLAPPGLPPMPGMTPPMMPPYATAMPVPPLPPGCPCPTAMPILSCPPTPDVMPTKVNPQVETCVQLLNLASELCSLVRPLNTPSVCASALELAMMGVRPTLDARLHSIGYSPQGTLSAPSIAPPPVIEVNEANTGRLIFGVGVNSNNGLTGSIIASGPGGVVSAGPPVVVPCAAVAPAKVCIIATSSGNELEMNVGDDTCIRCKKMTVKIGENEITVSRFDDRVRVRGEELKATADSVRSDRKDRLILEGDVVLHYKKDGHSANVTGDRIELNLSSGAVTIKTAEKPLIRPAVRIDRVDINEK